ncbi:MAG: mycoredoxin-dependent peroxiredoxin [Frankiaceae bacterium]|nr:mycoredoxin-dependent peroxiredoxin [Frankiaceae bacterium]
MSVVDVGAEAPDFELRDQRAQSHRLSSYRGKKNVVLVFYPFAFTGVCTGEMGAIRDDLTSLQNDETQVLAISCDTVAALRVFAERENLDYPLLSDFWPHGEVARAYGVFNEGLGAAERGTFIIDRQGVIRWSVRTSISDARAIGDYQKALADL